MPEHCAAHDTDQKAWMNEMLWQASLDPDQYGLFWCVGGRHYVRIAPLSVSVMEMMLKSLPVSHGLEYLGGTTS